MYAPTGDLLWAVKPSGPVSAGSVAGTIKPSGYREIGVEGTLYQAHRLVYAWHTGEWPDEVDHIDRDRGNNRIGNLRPATRTENMRNSDAVWSSSGYRGVTLRKDNGKYRARIKVDGLSINLGEFADPAEASIAYVEARKVYHAQ